jgi:hypothetical protein
VPGSIDLVVGAGARDFGRWRVSIEGDRASVEVRCHIYLEQAQTVDGPRADAENVVDVDLALIRTGEAWFVANEHLAFAPGGGP